MIARDSAMLCAGNGHENSPAADAVPDRLGQASVADASVCLGKPGGKSGPSSPCLEQQCENCYLQTNMFGS